MNAVNSANQLVSTNKVYRGQEEALHHDVTTCYLDYAYAGTEVEGR